MKVRRHDGSDIKRVLAGMVTDQTVCSRIASQWKPPGLFGIGWADMIGSWCIDHLQKYGEVPNGQIKSVFEDWAKDGNKSEKLVDGVEAFLVHLSDEYSADSPNASEYLLDVAGRVFEKTRLQKLSEEIEQELELNRVENAHDLVVGASKIELGVGSLVKLGEDYDAWREALDPDREDQLIKYQGKLNYFLGHQMTRDSFVAFMGQDKSCKSWMIQDAAFRAVRLSRRRVAYFEAGDLSRDQVLMRLGSRAARVPYRGSLKFRVPISVDHAGNVEHKTQKVSGLLTPQQAFRAWKKVCRGRDLFRLSCHPNSTLTVERIASIIWDWEREGWVADCVVIDYADILAAPKGFGETNDQIDEIWKRLRRLSQEIHGLVLTATQSSALAYGGKQRVLTRKHFSGRKTKLAHVTAMYGINITPEEEKNGTMRLNKVVCREGASSENQTIRVAGCLAIASPTMKVEEKQK